MIGRLLTSVIPKRCFPAVRSELQCPPTQIRPYPRRRRTTLDICPARRQESMQGKPSLENNYRTSRAGNFDVGVTIF
jgi:hypothetical protein